MDYTEAQVYEAMGLEVPAGANGQAVADPAAQPPAQPGEGVQGQELADPAAGGDAQAAQQDVREPGAVSADDDADDHPAEGKEPLTPQQRRENAARRRQQEQQEAIDNAVAAALKAERERVDQQMKGFFTQAGLRNPVTNEPIESMEQFEAWRTEQAAAQLRKDLRAGNLTPEVMQQLLDQHPAIQRLTQEQERQDIARQAQEDAQARARIDEDIRRISELDPTITKPADLLSMPNADAFRDYVKRGNSFLDAYKLANWDRLTQQAANAARQQALNNANSKNHLGGIINSRTGGMAEVPKDELAIYRMLLPHATDAEIQAHYNKNRKH